jgi:hypothetical protein
MGPWKPVSAESSLVNVGSLCGAQRPRHMSISVVTLLEEVIFEFLDERVSQEHLVVYVRCCIEFVSSRDGCPLVCVNGSAYSRKLGAELDVGTRLASCAFLVNELDAFQVEFILFGSG